MKSNYRTLPDICICLCILFGAAGCTTPTGTYSRTDSLSAPLAAGSTLAAVTYNGAITVSGEDVSECTLTATVIARAGVTKEDARRLADQVKVTLEPTDAGLTVKIDEPTLASNESITVNLDLTVPNQTDLELTTHNGAVRITDIAASIAGTTHNGKIAASEVSGNIILETYNGKVTCTAAAGDMQLKTNNGAIAASYKKSAPPVCRISLVTYNGGIELAAPPQLSAQVDISTRNGSVKSNIPITVAGQLGKRNIKGTIGAGEGTLELRTHNGSIMLR